MRVVSTPSAIDQAQMLANYDERFLVCREQHDLPLGTRHDHYDEERDDGGRLIGWRRVLMCRRCGGIATDRLGLDGRNKRVMRRPEGYSIPRDVGGYVTKRDVRLERVRRLFSSPRSAAGRSTAG